jgi:2-keto-4-pentenoate hydratase/2-oxohepta-3-ene-1,7-dioic acid hydratase in catechol pathway
VRWCTYSTTRGGPRAGLVDGDIIYGLAPPSALIEVLRSPETVAIAAASARSDPLERVSLSEALLHAPVPVPPSVRDFMAFEEHVVTSSGLCVDPLWYEIPVFYFSNPAAIRGPFDDVAIPPGCAAFDYELEIAAVIGMPGWGIPAHDAESHIAGYTILCDWSARDLQEREMKLNLGPTKGKDSATSLGPVLVSPDELEPYRSGNGYDLAMTAAVNGKPYSSGSFSAIHWSFARMIEHASRGTELRTGDVIGSGTVGTGCILELSRTHGSGAYPWLSPGDLVTLAIEHIGQIAAHVTPWTSPGSSLGTSPGQKDAARTS